MADCMVASHAKAATVFPVVSGTDIQGARVEDLVIEGNKDANVPLNGCRGAGIYLYRGFGTMIKGCVVRDYRGDGISFQQSNDVTVIDCVSEDNTDLGLHPGSGSQRPVVRNCVARRNGTDGLFLCWRVRHGVFEGNRLEGNGRFGISIGHKDSDNFLVGNQVLRNAANGVFFRDEAGGMSPHRNRLKDNRIEDNGHEAGTAGIRIRGEPSGLVFEDNVIRDTREGSQRTQTVGILVEDKVGPVEIGKNLIEAGTAIDDRRKSAPGLASLPVRPWKAVDDLAAKPEIGCSRYPLRGTGGGPRLAAVVRSLEWSSAGEDLAAAALRGGDNDRSASRKLAKLAAPPRLNSCAAPAAPSRGTSSRRPPSTPPRTASPRPRR